MKQMLTRWVDESAGAREQGAGHAAIECADLAGAAGARPLRQP